VTKHLLDENDVLQLLNEVIDRAGGQSAWARQTGVNRGQLNKVLRGKRALSSKILQALKLKKVYTTTPAAVTKTRHGPA
jgi:DNA-binding phage protein